jgi:hypothetical protein
MEMIVKYRKFQSTTINLDFTFLYPADWQVNENQGENYKEVIISGPRNKDNTYNAALIVRTSILTQAEGKSRDLSKIVADYVLTHGRLDNFHERFQAVGSYIGFEAVEVELGYTMLLPLNSINPVKTSIVERRILFIKNENLYEIIYRASDQVYQQFIAAFIDLVHTFEFLEKSAQKLSRPLITIKSR